MSLPDRPFVSIVLCTCNRIRDLPEAVDDLLAQTYSSYEILIVDHNSTDGTAEYAQRLASQEPRVSIHNEPLRGLSHARNRGIAAAKGEIVAWVDDDCRIPPRWLEAVVTAYRETGAGGVGGPAKAKLDGRPSWLTRELLRLGLLPGAYDRGPERRDVDWLIGCNLSFRRDVLTAVGQFRGDLGAGSPRGLAGEEVDFCARALRTGARLVYEPSAWVWHKMPRRRQSLTHALRFSFCVGMSNALIRRPVNRRAITSLHPLKLLVHMAGAAGRAYARTVLGPAMARGLSSATDEGGQDAGRHQA